MVHKEKIEELVTNYLGNEGLFLVSVRVTTTNKVMVFLDGDQGVSIRDCALLSRHIESILDRDKEDFELVVSSVGVGSPLIQTRQYKNNLGRLISVQLATDDKIRGKLLEVEDTGIRIEKEITKKGKRKKNPETNQDDIVFVAFNEIAEAKIMPQY